MFSETWIKIQKNWIRENALEIVVCQNDGHYVKGRWVNKRFAALHTSDIATFNQLDSANELEDIYRISHKKYTVL